MNNYGFDTKAIHAAQEPDSQTHSRALPIYQTTAYTFENVDHATKLFELKENGDIYSRLTNPTTAVLEGRIATLDGGIGAVAFSSGHAAMTATITNLAKFGDEIVSSINIYGGAINLFGITFKNYGINFKFVNPSNFTEWENAITDKTKALFAESVGNPNADVTDIEKLAALAHKHNIPLIIDATFVTPYLQKPIDFGADIIIHSATKFLGGHGTSMAGIVVDSGNFIYKNNDKFPQYNQPDESYHGMIFADIPGNAGFITRLRALVLRDLGSCVSPFNSFLILQGIETLSLRMQRHCENALSVAKFLQNHPKVKKVNYPMLESSPYFALSKKYLSKGAGGVFTIELEGGRDSGASFISKLKLFSHVANVGDVRSLVIHPATTTHSQLSDDQLIKSGITASTIRLSIGLEDIKDIISDLEQAL